MIIHNQKYIRIILLLKKSKQQKMEARENCIEIEIYGALYFLMFFELTKGTFQFIRFWVHLNQNYNIFRTSVQDLTIYKNFRTCSMNCRGYSD